MDVFRAFPKAVISGVWQLGKLVRNTEIGKRFEVESGQFDVIIDEITQPKTKSTPNADAMLEDTLLYAKPNQMPTTNAAELSAGYLWLDSETNTYYEITEVGVGKNQHTGTVEHLEFKLRPTGVVNG